MWRSIPSCCRFAATVLQSETKASLLPQVDAYVRARLRHDTVVASTQRYQHFSSNAESGSQREAVERMVDMMVRTPALQQMMMAALPPQMRNPQALQALFNNPATRSQIVDMIAKQGASLPPEILQRIGNTGDLESSLQQAQQMGLNPEEMFKRLLKYPGLMQKFQDPRVVRAFLDISQNPDNLEKYRDQPDIVEVYFKAKEVLLPQQQKPFSEPPPEIEGTSSTTSTSTHTTGTSSSSSHDDHPHSSVPYLGSSPQDSLAGFGNAMGIGSDEVLQRLLANPKAVQALSNPKVQAALQDVAGSKWKMVKYMFDPEIRDALKELQSIVDTSAPAKKQ